MHQTRATESPLGDALRVIRTPGRRANAYFLRAETMHGLYTYLEGLPSVDRTATCTSAATAKAFWSCCSASSGGTASI